MEQHTRRFALIFVAASLGAIGVLVACDTDNGVVPLPGGGSSTSSSSGKPKPGDDDDVTGDDDDDDDNGKADGGDAGCGIKPSNHSTDAGFYCGFLGRNADAGGKRSCTNDEVCCNPGRDGTAFPPTFCANTSNKTNKGNATCAASAENYGSKWVETGSSTWECGSAANCGAGKKCCLYVEKGKEDAGLDHGRAGGNGAPPASCNVTWLYNSGGSKCVNDCADDEFEACSKNDACSDGKRCVPAGFQSYRDSDRHQGYCEKD